MYTDYGSQKANSVSQSTWQDHGYTLLQQYCPDIAD